MEHCDPADRFTGCLLGGAVGDALGAPVEFMKLVQILRQCGPAGVRGHAPAADGMARITDDTQMTLFTAEGLIRFGVRSRFRADSSPRAMVAYAYLRWLRTQGERTRAGLEADAGGDGWLFGHRELHQRRAPGLTCLSALRAMLSVDEPAINNSKGCGGVMRVAPVGLFAWRLGWTPELTFDTGAQVAGITHGHPTGELAGGALAVMILALVDGANLAQAVYAARQCLRTRPGHEETLAAIEGAERLARSDTRHDLAIARLGEGWVAEEALAIGLYCALVADTFGEGVLMAVNHDGDSDSTGSIAGNLLGTLLGVQAIPQEWLEPLELRDVITELAEDLYGFVDWDIGEKGGDEELRQRVLAKYPVG
jgi:ADP-ribosylglycohydrolase